ncbi:tetratricopeptide repeat protein [Lysobacter terrae]
MQQAQQLNALADLLRRGAIAQALPLARQIVLQAPMDAEARQLLALCLAQSGDAGAAEAEFRQALQLSPSHPNALANLATLLRSTGRVEEAAPLWRRATAASPRFLQAWIDLGAAELSLGNNEAAATAFEKAIALQPSARAWHYLGNAKRAAGDLESAERAFRQAVALDPAAATAWINLGAVLRLLGRAEESLDCYRRAQVLGYSDPGLRDAVIGALTDTGRIEEALTQARDLVAEHPTFAPAQRTLAGLLWEYGPTLHAAEDPAPRFAAAAEANPDDVALQLAYFGFLLESRRADEAVERIEALRRRVDSPQLVRVHADALSRAGQIERAGVLYSQLYAAGERGDAFLNAWARQLLIAGDWEAARDRAGEVLRSSPWNQQALAYLSTAWRLLGDERELWLCDYERLIQPIELAPPDGFGTLEAFLRDLNAMLDSLHRAVREPIPESLRGGSQTPGQLFGRRDPIIEATGQALQAAVQRWLATLPEDASHPFLQRNRGRSRFSGSWSVKLRSAGHHVNHIHSGWISSAFYVALPPSVRSQTDVSCAGHIQFGQPPVDLGLSLEPRSIVRPEPGRLVLFPSYLWHGTVPFEDAEPRVTIAFDMVPAA